MEKKLKQIIEDDIQKAMFSDESTQTWCNKTATPEEIFMDIQEALDLLNVEKNKAIHKKWEWLSWYHGPILKRPPVIINNIVA